MTQRCLTSILVLSESGICARSNQVYIHHRRCSGAIHNVSRDCAIEGAETRDHHAYVRGVLPVQELGYICFVYEYLDQDLFKQINHAQHNGGLPLLTVRVLLLSRYISHNSC